MRGFVIGLMAASAALSLAACGKKEEAKTADTAAAQVNTAPEGSPMNPKRKPGLWEQTINLEDGPGAMTIKLCIDAATDAELSAFGNQVSKETCPENKSSRGLDGSWTFASTCDLGTGGIVKSEGKATGDFNSDYRVDATSTTTGAAAPQMNRTSKMTMTAKWVGACPADMPPGTMTMPGGMTIDIGKMKAMRDASPK